MRRPRAAARLPRRVLTRARSAARACCSWATTRATRTASSTSAATAAPACVSEPEGTMRRLQCPYHAWCYGFDGSLKSAPHTEEIEDFGSPGLHRAPHGGAPRAPVRRRLRHRRPARRPPRRPHAAPRALPPRRARARGARSPTTSRRTGRRSSRTTPSACTARACTPSSTASRTTMSGDEYEGAGAWCGGSMTLQRRRRDDGPERRPRPPPRDPRPHRHGAARRPLLRALPQPARQPPPRLRDGPHAVAARRRAHRGRVRVVLRARDDRAAGLRCRATPSSSGTWSTARTGRCASSSQRGIGSRGHVPGRYTDTEITVHAFDQLVADAYLTR